MSKKRLAAPEPDDAAFQGWVRSVFDHPVTEPAWWWRSTRAGVAEARPAIALQHVARLFEAPAALVQAYSSEQIGQALWYLADPSCSSHLTPLLDERVPSALRVRTLAAIVPLYRDLFARVCEPCLSHLDAVGAPTRRANLICYMFWDVAPVHPKGKGRWRAQDEACLDALRDTLAIDHLACQEGALHGLGHWKHAYPERVVGIIDAWLTRAPRRPPELLAYARSARAGYVQ